MEPATSLSFLAVIEFCIAQNSDDAWRRFERACDQHLERAFKQMATGAWSRRFSEFRPWFTNWAYARRVPHAAYRRLNKERGQGAFATEEEQSEFLLNYVLKAARNSALPEFINESAAPDDRIYQLALALSAPAMPETPIHSESGAELLGRLDPSYRVPFQLRHYKELGFPPAEDIEWMAAQAGRAAGEIRGLLDDAIEAGSGISFPIGSSLIAELCGIAPSPGGGHAAVDQRVRRARLKLQELWSAGGGNV